MTITKRTLTKWRKESLYNLDVVAKSHAPIKYPVHRMIELEGRVLRMTQELLDAHLMRMKGE